MNHKHRVHRTPIVAFMGLTAMLLCCVAFLCCPEGTEMVDDVLQPTSIVPGITEPPDAPTTPPPDAEQEDDLDEPTAPTGQEDTPADPNEAPQDDEPTTPPPSDTEPGGDLDAPTAPAGQEDTPADPNEEPEDEGAGAGGLGG